MRILAVLCGVLGLLMILAPAVLWLGILSVFEYDGAYHDTYHVVADVSWLVGYVLIAVLLLATSIWMWRRA